METKTKTLHFLKFWLPLYSYLVLIFAIASFPHPPEIIKLKIKAWFWHSLEYAPLPYFFFRAFTHSPREWLKKKFLTLGIFFSFLYGLTDELHQYFVPGRRAELRDVFYDSWGICIGTLFYLLLTAKLMRKTR